MILERDAAMTASQADYFLNNLAGTGETIMELGN